MLHAFKHPITKNQNEMPRFSRARTDQDIIVGNETISGEPRQGARSAAPWGPGRKRRATQPQAARNSLQSEENILASSKDFLPSPDELVLRPDNFLPFFRSLLPRLFANPRLHTAGYARCGSLRSWTKSPRLKHKKLSGRSTRNKSRFVY